MTLAVRSRSRLAPALLAACSWLVVNTEPVTAGPFRWPSGAGGNGNIYERLLRPGGSTWPEAQADSASLLFRGVAGHLVTVNSADEWKFIVTQFPVDWTWIGLTDQDQEGQFDWVTGEPVTFTRWIPNEPNQAGNEDYVFYQRSSGLEGDWGWNDFGDYRNVYTGALPIGFVVEYENPPELIADGNADCEVGIADYTLWASLFGQTDAGLAGDFDGNGTVGLGDYTLWAVNFGNTCAMGMKVPEPSGIVLAEVGFALALLGHSIRSRVNKAMKQSNNWPQGSGP